MVEGWALAVLGSGRPQRACTSGLELNGLAPQVSAQGIAQLVAQGLIGLRVGEVQAREIAVGANQSRQGFALGDRGGAVKARADWLSWAWAVRMLPSDAMAMKVLAETVTIRQPHRIGVPFVFYK